MLYCLAELLECPGLQNYCIEEMIGRLASNEGWRGISRYVVERVYESTEQYSPIRRFIVDVLLYRRNAQSEESEEDRVVWGDMMMSIPELSVDMSCGYINVRSIALPFSQWMFHNKQRYLVDDDGLERWCEQILCDVSLEGLRLLACTGDRKAMQMYQHLILEGWVCENCCFDVDSWKESDYACWGSEFKYPLGRYYFLSEAGFSFDLCKDFEGASNHKGLETVIIKTWGCWILKKEGGFSCLMYFIHPLFKVFPAPL